MGVKDGKPQSSRLCTVTSGSCDGARWELQETLGLLLGAAEPGSVDLGADQNTKLLSPPAESNT